ncbi:hypothetical protein TNCV_3484761 [Trichonephila clavipes]|nr:hypothetical protein TNCV_3484761 [Trichonephila clavipes]
MANRKAWMATAIFTEWVHAVLFRTRSGSHMKEKSLDFKKFLLIVDNAASHPLPLEHPNVNQLTSAQYNKPYSAIRSRATATFKKYYIKTTYKFILNKPENESLTLNIEEYPPESHIKNYTSSHYKDMVEDVGFTVVYCKQVQNVTTFPSDEIYASK